MERLPHGYTNRTRLVGDVVEKIYDGPRQWDNARRELLCLRALRGRLPLAEVVRDDPLVPSLHITALDGRHGQELLEEGHGGPVLQLVGEALASLHAIAPSTVEGLDGDGTVIVHGDFGPQNMLFDAGVTRVVGILDWESAHVGSPVEDLAWVEWIVRMHHPSDTDALAALFAASELSISWSDRHEAMLGQCRGILDYCESAAMHRSAADWRRLLAVTERWVE